MAEKNLVIQLDEHWRIEPDAACWQLRYEKQGAINKKTNKPSLTKVDSFHATLTQALTVYLDESLKACAFAEDLLARIKELEAKIEKAVGGIKRHA